MGMGFGILGAGLREGFGDRYGFSVFPGSIHEDWVGTGNLVDRIDDDPSGLAANGAFLMGGMPLGYGSLVDENGFGFVDDINNFVGDLFGLDLSDWGLGIL